MSAWLRYWYPGLRWTPKTVAAPSALAAEVRTLREEQRNLLAELEETNALLTALEWRLVVLERWQKAEMEVWGP